MESSKNGTVQQYLGNLMNEFNTAMSKLNALKMPSNDTIQIMAQVYNSSTEQKTSNQPVKPSTFGSTQASTQNPFETGIFGSLASTNQNQPAMSTSSIFGGSTASSFPQSSSIFGASNEQKSPFSFAQPKPSVFGGQSSSIFGASQVQPQPSASIFGSTQNQPQQSASIFGGQPTQSNVFGQSTFGSTNPAQSTNIFAPQQPQQQSIFASPIQPQAVTQNVFGSFNQNQNSMQTQEPQQQSIFGSTTSNIFQQPTQSTTIPFGQIQSTQTQLPSTNIFGASMIQNPPAAQPSQNVFAIQQPQNPLQQQPQNTMQQPTGGSIFSIQQPAANIQASSFGSNPFQTQSAPSIPESVYSKLEDLTQEELQQFQASEFTLGKIPLKPPAQNLCV